MAGIRDELVVALGWTTLYVSLSAAAVAMLLRALRVSSPRVHRASWTCVVLQAWLVYPLTIPFEVAPPSPVAAAAPSVADSSGYAETSAELALAGLREDDVDRHFDRTAAANRFAVSAVDEQRTLANWGDWMAIVWLGGAAVPAVWYLVRYARFVRAVPFGSAPQRREWRREWSTALREQRIRRRAELRMTESLGPLLCYVPFVYRVLVPRPLWVQLDRGGRLAILRHELAHLARGDLWKSVAVRVLALPQWFNPLVWWAVRRFDEAGEWACDDLAKGGRPEDQVGYAKTLVRLGELVAQTPAGAAEARGGSLSKRVHRIIHTCFTEDSAMKKGFVYLILVGLTAVHGLRVEVVAEEQILPESSRRPGPQVLGSRDEARPAGVEGASVIYTEVYDVQDLVRPSDASADLKALAAKIRSHVAPEAWGEGKGSIAPFPTNLSLVISQTRAVHEELADWMEAKRRVRDLERTGMAPYIIEPPDVVRIDAKNLLPKPPYKLSAYDSVIVRVDWKTMGHHPIAKECTVQGNDGTVDLGPPYGRFKVGGLTPREAETAIGEQLREYTDAIDVTVSLAASARNMQIIGQHLVRPDGSLDLGTYGIVPVVGLTIPDAEAMIELHLAEVMQEPDISLDVVAANSKVYYVITEGAAGGDNLALLPITGNETVLDAIAAAGGIERASEMEIHVSRPAANGDAQILPVDWDAITRRADTTTNYQLLPGDRLFIWDKSLNRELVDLAELEEEIEDQRQALHELESKLHERIANLEPATIEQIIRKAESAAGSSANGWQQPRETSAGRQHASAEASVELSGPVVWGGEFEEPTWAAVREALLAAGPDLQGKILAHEKTVSYTDEPREFPVVGRAQLQHVQFRVRTKGDQEASTGDGAILVNCRRLVMVPHVERKP